MHWPPWSSSEGGLPMGFARNGDGARQRLDFRPASPGRYMNIAGARRTPRRGPERTRNSPPTFARRPRRGGS